MPGFIDAIIMRPARRCSTRCWSAIPIEVEFVTIDSIIDKLRKRASETPPGTWVEGYFFDDTKVADKRQLNVHDLDKVSTTIRSWSTIAAGTPLLQQQALRAGRHHADHANPAGGTFDRDDHGQLNGRVTDHARGVFDNVGKRPTIRRRTGAAQPRGLAHISNQFVRYGLTSVHHQGGDLHGPAAGARPRRAEAPRELRGRRATCSRR